MRILNVIRLAVAIAACVAAVNAKAISLAELIRSGGSLTIGDTRFGNFGLQCQDVNPADVEVQLVGTGRSDDLWGLCFTSAGFSSANGDPTDVALFCTVETTHGLPLIRDIHQAFVLSAGGLGG